MGCSDVDRLHPLARELSPHRGEQLDRAAVEHSLVEMGAQLLPSAVEEVPQELHRLGTSAAHRSWWHPGGARLGRGTAEALPHSLRSEVQHVADLRPGAPIAAG